MSLLPFPVRVAAGLVVTAVEEARDLPRTVAGLPITAVSHVLQLSMRAQQVVTELAIKGDYALDGMRPVEEAPSWARFDEDEDVLRPLARGPYTGRAGAAWDAEIDEVELAEAELDELEELEVAEVGLAGADLDPAPRTNGHTPLTGQPRDDGEPTASVTPDALPGYETMTIAQLRGRLRALSLDQVTELLAWESAHADRPPFVTMLSNRITTLTAQG